MNEQQYRCLLENCRRRKVRRLSDTRPGAGGGRSTLGQVMERAVRAVRRRERAQVAWLRCVPATWSEAAGVVGVEGDTVVVGAVDSVVLHELRRRSGGLERQLARLVPGMRRLRIELDRAGDEDPKKVD